MGRDELNKLVDGLSSTAQRRAVNQEKLSREWAKVLERPALKIPPDALEYIPTS